MEMYYYIEKNRGIIAVHFRAERILKKIKFTPRTEKLKKAIESSIEKCIATDVVDELLKSDVSILHEMYHALYETSQNWVADCFCKEYSNSDKVFYEYTHTDNECNELIPCDAKLHQNIDTIIDILMQCDADTFIGFICRLVDLHVISRWRGKQSCYLYHINKQEAIKLLLAQITNKYQYDLFKACCAIICKKVLPYL